MKKPSKDNRTLNHAITYDGIDHLNISSSAETEFGRVLCPDYRKTFHIPHMGDFVSARAFANWMDSGGEESLRHSSKFFHTSCSVHDFRKLLVFAKYYQLRSIRTTLQANAAAVELPWVMYKRHISGIRELDRWKAYDGIVKAFVLDILNTDARERFNWVEAAPDTLECVNTFLRRMVAEPFTPYQLLDDVVRRQNTEADHSSDETSAAAEAGVEGEGVQNQYISQTTNASPPRGQTPSIRIFDESAFKSEHVNGNGPVYVG